MEWQERIGEKEQVEVTEGKNREGMIARKRRWYTVVGWAGKDEGSRGKCRQVKFDRKSSQQRVDSKGWTGKDGQVSEGRQGWTGKDGNIYLAIKQSIQLCMVYD
jgi:hypothetical protein